MGKILVVVVGHIRQSENVQLGLATPTSGVDWEQDRKCDAASDQASDDGHFQQPQEKKAIQRVVIEDIAVRSVEESTEPV